MAYTLGIDVSGTAYSRGDYWAARHHVLRVTGYGSTREHATKRMHALVLAIMQEMFSAFGPDYLGTKLDALGIKYNLTQAADETLTATLVTA